MDALSIIFLFVVIVGLILIKIKLPSIKGKIGEQSVSAVLSFLPKNEYVVINDIMLRSGNFTTQIDHIVVSVYGIFVIETKNYKGWILGNSHKDYWAQNIWGNKYPLFNPLFQNQKHISFLLRKFPMLREIETYIFPVVVFLRASRLLLSGDCEGVLKLFNVKSYIRSFTQEVISQEDCHKIASILKSKNILDRNERKTHKRNVKSAIYRRENKVKQRICPQCGGTLTLRNGKYGNFYGCSNYPSCRYTR